MQPRQYQRIVIAEQSYDVSAITLTFSSGSPVNHNDPDYQAAIRHFFCLSRLQPEIITLRIPPYDRNGRPRECLNVIRIYFNKQTLSNDRECDGYIAQLCGTAIFYGTTFAIERTPLDDTGHEFISPRDSDVERQNYYLQAHVPRPRNTVYEKNCITFFLTVGRTFKHNDQHLIYACRSWLHQHSVAATDIFCLTDNIMRRCTINAYTSTFNSSDAIFTWSLSLPTIATATFMGRTFRIQQIGRAHV